MISSSYQPQLREVTHSKSTNHRLILMLENFFSVRIIDVWDSLPISLINCETIAKKHLDCLLKNPGYIYKLF